MSILWWIVGLFIVGAVAYSLISREAIDDAERNNDGMVIINDEEFSEELGDGAVSEDIADASERDRDYAEQAGFGREDEESSEELSGYGNGDFRYRQYTGGYGVDPHHEGRLEENPENNSESLDNTVSLDNEVSLDNDVSGDEKRLNELAELAESPSVITSQATLSSVSTVDQPLKDEALYGAKELYNTQSDEEYGRDYTDDVHGFAQRIDDEDAEYSKNVDFADSRFLHNPRDLKRSKIEDDDDDDLPMSSRTRMEEETYMNRHDVRKETNSGRKNKRK